MSTPAPPVTPSDLDARYGRTPRAARGGRRRALIVAAAFAVVLIAWVVWAGLLGQSSELDARDVGHEIIDDSTVSIGYQLTIEPGTEARCALQALNDTFAVIGWKVVDVPASPQRVRVLDETVRTTELAVTGLIYKCWPA